MRCKDWRVLITGASSGIGRACAELFAAEGAKLLLSARSADKLTALATQLEAAHQTDAYTLTMDIRDRNDVSRAMESLPPEWQYLDVLVNNAGLALGLEKIHEGNTDDWEQMIDTNIKGALYVSRYVVKRMLDQQKGHIINLGSIAGHEVYSGGVVYCATKFAMRAISDGLKMDVHGSPVRVTSIDPGMVMTQFSVTRFGGDQEKADEVYKGMNALLPEDIADAIVYCATRPPHINVRDMIIMPTDQSATHLCYRREEQE